MLVLRSESIVLEVLGASRGRVGLVSSSEYAGKWCDAGEVGF